jgi:hypothetical protein
MRIATSDRARARRATTGRRAPRAWACAPAERGTARMDAGARVSAARCRARSRATTATTTATGTSTRALACSPAGSAPASTRWPPASAGVWSRAHRGAVRGRKCATARRATRTATDASTRGVCPPASGSDRRATTARGLPPIRARRCARSARRSRALRVAVRGRGASVCSPTLATRRRAPPATARRSGWRPGSRSRAITPSPRLGRRSPAAASRAVP